jgi:CHRD domain/PEP-CTERM motif
MKHAFALAALVITGMPVAQAATTTFQSGLSPEAIGASGTGLVEVIYDATAHTLKIDSSFSGLSGTTTVAHIHCCVAAAGSGTAGVAVTPGTLPGFPAGVKSGSYSTTLDLTQSTTFTGAFFSGSGGTAAGAEARLFDGMLDGLAYFNVHSSSFGGGEIRGFLAPIPEPSTYALMALGLVAVGAVARRRRS